MIKSNGKKVIACMLIGSMVFTTGCSQIKSLFSKNKGENSEQVNVENTDEQSGQVSSANITKDEELVAAGSMDGDDVSTSDGSEIDKFESLVHDAFANKYVQCNISLYDADGNINAYTADMIMRMDDDKREEDNQSIIIYSHDGQKDKGFMGYGKIGNKLYYFTYDAESGEEIYKCADMNASDNVGEDTSEVSSVGETTMIDKDMSNIDKSNLIYKGKDDFEGQSLHHFVSHREGKGDFDFYADFDKDLLYMVAVMDYKDYMDEESSFADPNKDYSGYSLTMTYRFVDNFDFPAPFDHGHGEPEIVSYDDLSSNIFGVMFGLIGAMTPLSAEDVNNGMSMNISSDDMSGSSFSGFDDSDDGKSDDNNESDETNAQDISDLIGDDTGSSGSGYSDVPMSDDDILNQIVY